MSAFPYQLCPDSIPVIGSKITEIYPKVFWNDLKILFSKTAFANYSDLNLWDFQPTLYRV